jgi:hypothetical protein
MNKTAYLNANISPTEQDVKKKIILPVDLGDIPRHWGYEGQARQGDNASPCILHITHNKTSPQKNRQIEWVLPGKYPKPDCNEFIAYQDCNNRHKGMKPYYRNHHSHLCACWSEWQRRVAIQETERLYEACKLNGLTTKTIRHIVISPPVSEYPKFRTEREFKNITKKLYRLLDKYIKGMYGGDIVFHYYRLKHIDGSECEEKRFCDREHIEIESPHFHYIGTGYFVNSDVFYRETGWVYKTIRKIRDERECRSTLRYIMSHCAIDDKNGKQGNKIIRQIGFNSKRKLGRKVIKIDITCKICGERIELYDENKNPTGYYLRGQRFLYYLRP